MTLKPHQLRHVENLVETKQALLLDGPGLGKTLTVLKTFNDCRKTGTRSLLVVAPFYVATTTWPAEVKKWFPELKVCLLNRDKDSWETLRKGEADVYVANFQIVSKIRSYVSAWTKKSKSSPLHPNMLVIDEAHNLKSPSGAWQRDVRFIRSYMSRVIAMTGTPLCKQVTDLFSIARIVDKGERLGAAVKPFREKYMAPHPYRRHDWVCLPGAETDIRRKLNDITFMYAPKELEGMPGLSIHIHKIQLGDESRKIYDEIHEDLISTLPEGQEITASTSDVAVGKLQQLASGFIYLPEGGAKILFWDKVEKVRELAKKGNLLVFCAYVAQREILEMALGATEFEGGLVDSWNRGEIPLLVADYRSISEGLNLQSGGHLICWFTPPWTFSSLDQGNKRVHRMGQTKDCEVHLLVSEDTVDEWCINSIAMRSDRLDEFKRGPIGEEKEDLEPSQIPIKVAR